MSNHPFTTPPTPAPPAVESSGGTSKTVIIGILLGGFLLMSLVCGGVLLALLLPAVQAARNAAQTMQTSNNLKQVGLAIHNYHSAYRQLPAAAATDLADQPLWSWRVALLPFAEEQARWSGWQQDQAWNSGANSPLLVPAPPVYSSPLDPDPNTDLTHVFAVRHPQGIMSGEPDLRFRDVTDGLSNTILAVYLPDRTAPWAAPDDISLSELQSEFANVTKQRPILVLFADGAVRIMSSPLDAATVEAMVTRDGDESINSF